MQFTADRKLVFHKLKGNLKVVGFGDAAHKNLDGQKSQGGHLTSAMDSMGVSCLVSWSSKRSRRHQRSTFGAELVQQELMVDKLVVVKRLLQAAMGVDCPVHMRTDCLSLVKNVHSHRAMVTEEMLMEPVVGLRDELVHGDVQSFEFCPSRLNVADGMSKPEQALRVPILKLMRGTTRLWTFDPLVSGAWRQPPEC
jgi:hypothetical protein